MYFANGRGIFWGSRVVLSEKGPYSNLWMGNFVQYLIVDIGNIVRTL